MNSNSIDWLKNAFGHVDKITKKAIMSIPKDVMDDVEQTLNDCPEYETIKHVIYCISHEMELKKCATCGKTLTYSKAFVFHCEYCSYSCIDNRRRADRVKEAMQQKYGVDNISQCEEAKEKKRRTSLKHYGTENVFQSSEVKERQKNTCIEKYGVENVFQSEKVKEKSRETNRKRYGTDYACQNDDVKKKTVATNIAKYGVENPSQNDAIKEKRNSTCIERFGTDNIFKNESFIRRNLDRTYEDLKERWKGL